MFCSVDGQDVHGDPTHLFGNSVDFKKICDPPGESNILPDTVSPPQYEPVTPSMSSLREPLLGSPAPVPAPVLTISRP